MTATTKGSLFSSLRALSDEIGTQKTAAAAPAKPGTTVKKAGPTPSDPGGYQGATTHPSKDIDNNVQDSQEGARSSENATDVKADQPVGVDNTSEATPNQDQQDEQQLNIGTQQSATGEDASVEDDYKDSKDDPGTTHPAKADDGEKYSSLTFKQAYVKSTELGNQILADLANGFGSRLDKSAGAAAPAKAGGKPPAPPQPKQPTKSAAAPAAQPPAPAPAKPAAGVDKNLLKAAEAASASPAPEVAAGYELAAMLGIDKTAALNSVQQSIATTIRDAQIEASLLGGYWTGLRNKTAGDMPGGAAEGEDHSKPGDDASGSNEGGDKGGGGEGGGGGGEGGGGGGGEPSLGDLLGGGGGAPGGDMGGMGGGMGGGAGQEQALMQLAAALAELGISPEALMQAAQGGGDMGGMGGGMGGGPPGGAPAGGDPLAGAAPSSPMSGGAGGPPGGMPGMEVAAAAKARAVKAAWREEATKLASAVRQFQRAGKFRLEAPKTAEERKLRETMRDYMKEVVQNI